MYYYSYFDYMINEIFNRKLNKRLLVNNLFIYIKSMEKPCIIINYITLKVN